MSHPSVDQTACTYLARLAHGWLLADDGRFSPDRCRELLEPIIAPEAIERWLERVDASSIRPIDRPVASIQAEFSGARRRRGGIYFTPTAVADGMAAAVVAGAGEVVIDLAAGAASLLAAVARRRPTARMIGVESDPLLAVAAAVQLAGVRQRQARRCEQPDRIFVGDGLARDERWRGFEGQAAAVVLNPPYVREKGNRELFRRLQREHPHLAEHFGPRMDLQYLFSHRAAALLRPQGRLVLLSTAYWLTATNASELRGDLSSRFSPEVLVRVEKTGVFSDAPGQHSLLSVFRRGATHQGRARAVSIDDEPDDWPSLLLELLADDRPRDEVCEPPISHFGADPWSPFVVAGTRRWGERLERAGTPLGELADDRQGFVSGADRFSSRHPKRYPDDTAQLPEPGEPIFLFGADEVPEVVRRLGPTVLRPVLRASRLGVNEVIVSAPDEEFALYLDDEVSADNEAVLAEHLGRFRPVLEHRREARLGSMPWYRVHWPRTRREQTGPKLVVPRRARAPRFSLDLSASCVSSDCTYLIAPAHVARPLDYLIVLMVTLNSELVTRYLRSFGKSKGEQLEFYSEPLRCLPLPLRMNEEGELVWIEHLIDAHTRDQLHIQAGRIRSALHRPCL